VNFTFIADSHAAGFDFSTFCGPVLRALASFGVKAELSGRNDMCIGGRKFSGNSMYIKDNRMMHHGTILYDSDLTVLSRALKAPKDKIESNGVASVRERVTNIRPHMPGDVPVEDFIGVLRDFMLSEYKMEAYSLTDEDISGVGKLSEKYRSWAWNYGESPGYSTHRTRRFDGCGKVEVFMKISRGIVDDICFYGDFFGSGDHGDIIRRLKGCRLAEEDLRAAMDGIVLDDYFRGLRLDDFISLII